MNIQNLVRENIKNLTPYSSARDEFSADAGVFLDANENPFGDFNRYPDPYQKALKTEISKLKNIEANKIFLGNGSDEVIDLSQITQLKFFEISLWGNPKFRRTIFCVFW